ncbi:MAG TPA: hypothetical protein VHY91_26365 [Pirellulales bacterium]|jgi:hypothetical protein|nr:hypothetical protein [Pirellulales bacterium]
MSENRATPASRETTSAVPPDVEAKMSEAEYAAYQDLLHAEVKGQNGVAGRVCGECTACCTVLTVHELKKGSFQQCPHDCGRCVIYDTRPRSCRSWSCSWLLGRIEGDERRRPDKIGLIFNRETLAGKSMTVAIEVWPGAGRESGNAFLLQKMSKEAPIIVRQYQIRGYDVITSNSDVRKRILQSIETEWHPKPQNQPQPATPDAQQPNPYVQIVANDAPPPK